METQDPAGIIVAIMVVLFWLAVIGFLVSIPFLRRRQERADEVV